MINFLAMCLCTACAIKKGIQGDIFWRLIEICLAIANLPFVIIQLKKYLDKNVNKKNKSFEKYDWR